MEKYFSIALRVSTDQNLRLGELGDHLLSLSVANLLTPLSCLSPNIPIEDISIPLLHGAISVPG